MFKLWIVDEKNNHLHVEVEVDVFFFNFREPGDVLGIMLESNPDTKAILVHTIQEASLADR